MADPRLPAGYRVERPTLDAADELAEHFARVFQHQSGRSFLTREDLANALSAPDVDPSRDGVVVRAEDGTLVAQEYSIAAAPYVSSTVVGVVSPDHCGRGIGSALLEWAEERVAERTPEAPEGARVAFHAICDADHEPSIALFEGNGLSVDRYFVLMALDFAGPPPAPVFPPGIEVRSFDTDGDLEAAYRAMRDAFQDHFGYVETPIEEGLARLRHRVERPDHDPTMWWHAYDGDDIVANCWCVGDHEGDERGYVMSLGVRRPYRGRGLGKGLLRRAFTEFHTRGKTGAALDVDADSITGATRLYESVGMQVRHRNAAYEKEVRAGQDLLRRA